MSGDDDVIMHLHGHTAGGGDNLPGHFNIGLRRGGVATGVIMQQNDRGCGMFKRAFYHLARINGRVIYRAALHHLIRNQRMAAIEK